MLGLPCDAGISGPDSQLAQWAQNVTAFSSEYGGDWGVHQLLGEPNVYPRYEHTRGAWTVSESRQGAGLVEYLELSFTTLAVVSAVEIYETYGAGSCIKIQVLEPAGVWDTVWQGPKSSQSSFTTAQIFRPQLKLRAVRGRKIQGINRVSPMQRLSNKHLLACGRLSFGELHYYYLRRRNSPGVGRV